MIGIFIVTFTSALFFNSGILNEKKKNLRTNNTKIIKKDNTSKILKKIFIPPLKKYISPDLPKSVYIKNLRGTISDKIIQWYSKNDTCFIIEETIMKKNNTKNNTKNKYVIQLLFGLYGSFIVYFLNIFNIKNKIKNENETKNKINKKFMMGV